MHTSQHQLDAQMLLEEDGLSRGAARFRRRLQEAEQKQTMSGLGAAKTLLRNAIEPMEKAVSEWVTSEMAAPRRRHVAAGWLHRIMEGAPHVDGDPTTGAEIVVYMTLKVVLDGIARRVNAKNQARMIGELIEDELRLRLFQSKAPELFQYKMDSFHTSHYGHRKAALNQSIAFACVDTADVELPAEAKIRVGLKLIDLLRESTGLIELETVRGAKQIDTYIVPAPETRSWLQRHNEALVNLTPVFMPMVAPPLPWGPGELGGYRYALRGKVQLVRGISKQHAARVASTDMPVVYRAINAIQATAWQVNAGVLAVVREVYGNNLGLATIPEKLERPMPPRPQDIDTNEDTRKAWRKKAHAVKEFNHERHVEDIGFGYFMGVVESVEKHDAFWFPYNLDFRGRVYPVSAYLSPQGSDLSKGLLRFAQGKPLGPDGARWLALHGANCLGTTPEGAKLSKVTLDARYRWVMEHQYQIADAAEEPLSNRWWTEADDPWQFLAFCQEWTALWAWVAEGNAAEDFVSHLAVAQDGSCNGLQHFSAMLRDPIGGAAVNVAPSPDGMPQDIYLRVAELVLDKLERLAVEGDELAERWLSSGLVGRKLCKRPTMTYGYGSRTFGFKKQLRFYLEHSTPWAQTKAHFTVKEGDKDKVMVKPACGLMAKLISEALRETVIAAADAMDWMQKSARKIAKENTPVAWTVPLTGFPVRQEYFKATSRQIKTTLAGKVFKPRIYTNTRDVATHRQANAIAPNFVHSLDAAALMLTVSRSEAEQTGMSFAMVHDSYGTHAADAALLARVTRQSFVSFYSTHDVVASLYEQLQTLATETELDAPPAKGDLDVSLVLASDYFFA